MHPRRRGSTAVRFGTLAVAIIVTLTLGLGFWKFSGRRAGLGAGRSSGNSPAAVGLRPGYRERLPVIDSSGFLIMSSLIPEWKADSSLAEIASIWRGAGFRAIDDVDKRLADAARSDEDRVADFLVKASLYNFEGEVDKSYQVLCDLRLFLGRDERLAGPVLATVVYYQGVVALRRGETDNCVMCRGESSCILPIVPAAVHTIPAGSRLAIGHFSEYLALFPDDLEVRWLLNLASMTLGEYPERVDRRYRLDLARFFDSEFNIGKFREVSLQAKVDRLNQSGGAIMEDFDNDGLLDIAVSSLDPNQSLAIYRNKGDSTFEERTEQAGVTDQLGGLVCYQTDYDNDGRMDIYVPRGAWLRYPVRPSLLRNNGSGGFVDVTSEAGLLDPVNSNAAAWADYDNDGLLDLFVACEKQTNRLYRNKGNGSFEEVAERAGVQGSATDFCKGCTWIDYDNDGYPDLFVDNLAGAARLYHNDRDGKFSDLTSALGINGPYHGFSCWTWDFDNDGWLDIFAASYDRSLGDIVKGLLGQPHGRYSSRLYRNQEGKGFADVTKAAGLDMVFATMGSNYGDFDNDGFLDMYLGTGEPDLATLVPNRMFKNVDGVRFADISASSGTGHLQKGHGVACGDWDRDGDVDLFVETGGALNGDRYHNLLFQNPGQGNHWLTVKLVGKKTNRAALGARIKVVTAGEKPRTICRHVSAGSSFGGSPLQQTIGLARAGRIDRLEIHWPTSKTTQVFRDIAADQAIEVTEFAENYRRLDWKPLPQPK